MSRNGKIARLPQGIREELNRRLQDGNAGPGLLRWLNELEECQDVLDEEFDGRPITKQNLSEWRLGGYEDWIRKEEARQRVSVMIEKAGDLEKDAGGMAIADRVGTLLAAELAVATEQLDSIKDPKERWAQFKEIAREVHRLRREDHHARKLRMAEEQYERREKQAEKKKLLKMQESMQNKHLMVSIQGGGDEAWKWTDWRIRVRHGLPMPLWWRNPQTAEEWSELMMPYWREEVELRSSPKGETGPKSKVHPPSPSYGATSSPKSNSTADSRGQSKSEAVRPGRTKSDQKSEPVASGPSESGSVAKEATEGNGEEARTDRPPPMRTASMQQADPTKVPEVPPRSAPPKAPSPLRSAGAVQKASGPVSGEVRGKETLKDMAEMGSVGPKQSEDEDDSAGNEA